MIDANLPADPIEVPAMSGHVVFLPDMTPATLGPTVFARVLHCIRRAAAHYSPGCHEIEAVYDPTTHEKTGYQVTVPDKLTALRIRLSYDTAPQCRPMPWVI